RRCLGTLALSALVAQGIEQWPPEPCAQVRILPRAHSLCVEALLGRRKPEVCQRPQAQARRSNVTTVARTLRVSACSHGGGETSPRDIPSTRSTMAPLRYDTARAGLIYDESEADTPCMTHPRFGASRASQLSRWRDVPRWRRLSMLAPSGCRWRAHQLPLRVRGPSAPPAR